MCYIFEQINLIDWLITSPPSGGRTDKTDKRLVQAQMRAVQQQQQRWGNWVLAWGSIHRIQTKNYTSTSCSTFFVQRQLNYLALTTSTVRRQLSIRPTSPLLLMPLRRCCTCLIAQWDGWTDKQSTSKWTVRQEGSTRRAASRWLVHSNRQFTPVKRQAISPAAQPHAA